ncbi:hypothetical protein YPPY72_0562, partial [Yersinia pestis PY-72]
MIGDFHTFEAFFQLGQFIHRFLHQFWCTVNTATLFHRQTHFIANLRPVLCSFLFHQVAQAGL